MKHYNIPIFIPHAGCPFRCVFCNQKHISGKIVMPKTDDVIKTIEEKLSTIDYKNSHVEVAFFGGSFTCIDIEQQKEYLQNVQEYIKQGIIKSIRISTRPDYIDNNIISFLKEYNVNTIELGVQSMRNEILEKSGRGHTVENVIRASELIKNAGIKLGIQTMLGLPGEQKSMAEYTATEVCRLYPDFVRIYPVLVLKDTELETMYKKNEYSPLNPDEAVDWTCSVVEIYLKNNIKIIKVGLHPMESETEAKKIIAGPFHPAFRELVMTEIWNKKFRKFIYHEKKLNTRDTDVTITVPGDQYNFAIGYQAKNRKMLEKYFRKVTFQRSDHLINFDFELDYH